MRKETLEAVFICLTPLQMVIAEAIIRDNNIQCYGVILLELSSNEKYKFYYNRLAVNANFAMKFTLDTNARKLFLLKDVWYFKKKVTKLLQNKKICILYVATICNYYIQTILSYVEYDLLCTFDDGIGNLNFKDVLYSRDNMNFHKRLIWSFLFRRMSIYDIRKQIHCHYTIYSSTKNISNNLKYIPLFEKKKEYDKKQRYGSIKIFLGQPLMEINSKLTPQVIGNIMKNLNIDQYFPHPRETYIIPNVIYIDCNQIFEEYVCDLYTNSTYQSIEIYSFFSTVLANLNDLGYVKLYSLVSPLVPRSIYTIYSMFKNISFINVDNGSIISTINPLVSVVIPCYNHEQFVQECIQSVIDQDYQNIELIIIDDGSQDQSVQKIEEMRAQCEERFARFEFRHRPNKGLCATLNEAVEWCKGEYYSSIASDDVLLPYKISKQVQILQEKSCIGVFGGASLIDEYNDIMFEIIPSKRPLTYEHIILSNYTILAPTQLLDLQAVKSLGKPIYSDDLVIEDWYMWLKLSQIGQLINIQEVLVKYRQHDHNTMKNLSLIQQGRYDVLAKFKHDELYDRAVNTVKYINMLESKKYSELLLFIIKRPYFLLKYTFYKRILLSFMGRK
ncbi:glycosyltransferase [Wohlfahrtiimonas chitiniclastica]|uniref:glycosyltransferase family 52 n=1 Tax=Wohlfahrtiimonas chitiniclastica TaxID=400946 RepID=UPI001BCF2F94|nr:glycosyltransferase family 52 [Wohlfahrtiimonas chitiniclastica]MBS7820820.1 glycosyltransferase [Wohlfahrtiimonas chitiniclastica]